MSTSAIKQPSDYKQKQKPSAQRADAQELDVDVEYDGETYVVAQSNVKRLDFLAAIEDEEYITALRLLLGREQAARLFEGHAVEDVGGFFDALGEAIDAGNR